MYNRYIPGTGGHSRVVVDEPPKESGRQTPPHQRAGQIPVTAHGRRRALGRSPFLGGEDKNAGIAGILRALHLEALDSGDILLLLIILFLFLEGDDLELVITLALMLLLSLGDERSAQNE